MGAASSATILFIVFGFDQIITYIFISSSIFFSGFWGYRLGSKFKKIDKNSKYKAMLLGITITIIAVITAALFSAIASIFVLGNGFSSPKDFLTFITIATSFAVPVTIPLGAIAGYNIHKIYDDEQNA